MTAVERATELAMMPMKDLPGPALEYARHLCSKWGMCGETFITAYAHYAQCMEGLECDDPLYRADALAAKWFAEHGADTPTVVL